MIAPRTPREDINAATPAALRAWRLARLSLGGALVLGGAFVGAIAGVLIALGAETLMKGLGL